ncbi:hypothetical protein M0Q50_07955 [bacterium]|jgi:hypothetical protein|nr:hypothetical protein [bacterium]
MKVGDTLIHRTSKNRFEIYEIYDDLKIIKIIEYSDNICCTSNYSMVPSADFWRYIWDEFYEQKELRLQKLNTL